MDGIRVGAIDSSLIFQIRLLSDDKGVGLWVCLCKIGFGKLINLVIHSFQNLFVKQAFYKFKISSANCL